MIWSNPVVIRLTAVETARGSCDPSGSGDTLYCMTGSVATGYGCYFPGNSASGVVGCNDPGNSPS